MSVWDIGPFDNDLALDWVQDLQESNDLYYIEDTLNNVLEEGETFIPMPFACEALAAIDVLARLQGQPGDEAVDDVDAWVETLRKKFKRRADLVEKSLKALELIVSEKSELANEWAQTDEHVAWRGMVEQLRARVTAM
ncbi:hypothetical protein GCM10027277_03160 [Pseudoduganella ginsengisoli]|uniref:DUF4259 domain-containing protein n=1 Tax=Pseudoduganella ginsengisoli TaxID=1462440 RepID=A0A6L6Q659_9BURK|nr:DUF4259 domain-containing protein [Pseudoduganella ginsengisoli]MTW04751.1 DUF4259 domain-containing protein [Pseudoduganella ginsengisoli]